MNRGEFIRFMGLSTAGLAANRTLPKIFGLVPDKPKRTWKQWTWITKDAGTSIDNWKQQFSAMKSAGIDAILPEIYNSFRASYGSRHLPVQEPWLEKILPVAKAEGLEVHAWMWTMPCNVDEIIKRHPEWYVVNRLGESSVAKPAYVDFYKFLCPSRPEVWEFLQRTVNELSQYNDLDGIHLDYIRYPDVILPVKLQPRYHIIQDREYPQYDYCYCDVCRHDFKEATGRDPMTLSDPASDKEWNQFRYDRITHIVDDVLAPIARARGKKVTAAVFPNWKNVRQQWLLWNLDGAMPMLYAGFYDKGVNWIEAQTSDEVKALHGRTPLYSGLAVTQLEGSDFVEAIMASYKGGSNGVSLFSAESMTANQWANFSKAIKI